VTNKNVYYILDYAKIPFLVDKADANHMAGHSCVIPFDNFIILFGGSNFPSQITIIYPEGLHKIGRLPFNFHDGSCHRHHNDAVFSGYWDFYTQTPTYDILNTIISVKQTWATGSPVHPDAENPGGNFRIIL